MSAWLNGADLEQALHLKPSARDYSARNEALRAAGLELDNDAHELAARIRRFERTWPRWKHLDRPPAGADAVDVELFRAFSTGRKIPSSPKHLSRILSG